MKIAQKTYTEEELVAFLKNKDESGFSVIYDNYSTALYGIIFRIVNSEEIACDVLQEAFVKIWNKGETYDVSKGRLFTWMLNISKNLAIDMLRSKDYKKNHQIRNIEDSVNRVNRQTNTHTKVDHIGLKEVVATLKEEYKQLIDLLYFGGYTQEEASKELNLPLGTVKTRARTAINQLRDLLKENS